MMDLTPILQKNSPRRKIQQASTDTGNQALQNAMKASKSETTESQNLSKEGVKSRTDTANGPSRNSEVKS